MEVLISYGKYFQHLWSTLMMIDKTFMIIFGIVFLLIHLGISLIAYKLLKPMEDQIKPIISIPVINVYYVAFKGVHPLFVLIIIFETIFLLPLPFITNDVVVIHSLIQNYAKILLILLIITEYFISIVALVIRYVIYNSKIKIVR